MATIVYPGTFDPITNGHVDLIERASRLFDKVIIAVAFAHHKKTLFSFEDRLKFISAVFKNNPKIEIRPMEGLLVNFVKTNKADVVLRGLRSAHDFEYEFQLAGMNRSLDDHCETIFMTPSQNTLFISSTLVREIISLRGDVSRFIPKVVVEHLQHVA